MGPQPKLWHALESAATVSDDEANLTIEDLLNLARQAVLLAGKTNDTISYHRWLSALASAMNNSSQTESMIKDKSTPLENSRKEFFGKEFR